MTDEMRRAMTIERLLSELLKAQLREYGTCEYCQHDWTEHTGDLPGCEYVHNVDGFISKPCEGDISCRKANCICGYHLLAELDQDDKGAIVLSHWCRALELSGDAPCWTPQQLAPDSNLWILVDASDMRIEHPDGQKFKTSRDALHYARQDRFRTFVKYHGQPDSTESTPNQL